MGMAKVWNDNTFPHVEKYKGQTIEIPPGKYIEMDRDEALQLQGQFKAPRKRGDGTDDPRFFKMIRLEGGESITDYNPLTNPITGKVAESPEALRDELAPYKDLLVKDDKKDSEMAAMKRENDALRAEMQDIKAILTEIRNTNVGKNSAKR